MQGNGVHELVVFIHSSKENRYLLDSGSFLSAFHEAIENNRGESPRCRHFWLWKSGLLFL